MCVCVSECVFVCECVLQEQVAMLFHTGSNGLQMSKEEEMLMRHIHGSSVVYMYTECEEFMFWT